MENEYGLLITENIENWRTPNDMIFVSTYEDAYYWAKRIIELGSKGVTVWRGKNLIDIFPPKSKETEQRKLSMKPKMVECQIQTTKHLWTK